VSQHPKQKPAGLRELSPRSVVVGLLVALVIGASYPYMVLKFGFGPNISVVSAFFGFLALGLFSRNYNRWENNIVQTAGTTAGQIAFLCWLLAAFDILSAEPGSRFQVHLTWAQTWIWLSASGLLGVLLAVPLRKHFIEDEQLRFADGVAAGETLIMLDSSGPEARRSAFAMVGALVASGLTFLATQLRWIADSIPVTINAFSARGGVGLAISLLNIGSGMIIGPRVSASMMLGAVIGWILFPPWLLAHGFIAPDAKRVDILLTVMWPAVGMMVAAGMAGLLLRWRVLLKSFQGLAGARGESHDLPLRTVWIGAGGAAALLAVLQWIFFATPVWQSVLAILFAVPLGLVALRVLGETNWGPISTMVNLVQAIFGALAPGDLRASMVSSGITGAVAAESEGLMQDYKVGWMIGSTPRILTYMQLMAVPVGALALALMYPLLRDTYGIVGEHAQLLSPTSQRWVGFAKVVTNELGGTLSPAAAARLWWMKTSFAWGAVVGVLITLLELRPAWRRFVPSPTGMGIAMLIPFNAVAGIFAGAMLDQVWARVAPRSQERYSVPAASGLIAGEALVAVAIPILVTLGLMTI
jgi:uncharacterized oligopeptide transporter (OPT) family protein